MRMHNTHHLRILCYQPYILFFYYAYHYMLHAVCSMHIHLLQVTSLKR